MVRVLSIRLRCLSRKRLPIPMSADKNGFWLSFPVFIDCESLSDFLAERLSAGHRAVLDDLFSQQCIYLDDLAASPQQNIHAGQNVRLFLSEHQEETVDTGWQLIWENDEMMAVFKPHLLPVSRTTRNLYNTLISLIRRETPYVRAHLLHRLDTETAGVMMVAKNSEADKKWKPKLDQLISRKIYHAWVDGSPQWEGLLFECELSVKTGSAIRSQVYVVDPQCLDLFPKPKLSKTGFKVLRREAGKTLIECQLFTGRKHQIRAQLAHLGYPIIGDKVYAHQGYYYLKRIGEGLSRDDLHTLGSPFHCLTAVKLRLQGGVVIELPASVKPVRP